MNQKKELINQLNDIVLNFEGYSQIVNYAIQIKERIILSPNTNLLTQEKVLDILEKLDIEKIEENFQKGTVNLINFEFEDAIIYYLKVTPTVNILVTPQKEQAEGVREKLIVLVEQIKPIVEQLSTLPSEEDVKIQAAFDEIDTLINEFKIPRFEGFKKLVKFAVPFKKKE